MKSHRKFEQLQISRQPALTISDDSHKIQKPPSSSLRKKKPVIIYVLSPEVIHVEASGFMSLVQRLTGQENNNSSTSGSGGGDKATTSSGASEGALNRRQLPVRVKARVLKNSTGGSGDTMRGMIQTTNNNNHNHNKYDINGHVSSSPATGSPLPMLYFHDLSPPALSVRKDGTMASPGWLLNGDEFLDQNDRFQTSFLDIFNQVHDQYR